ncbi:MAG: hypothetical protein ACPGVU_13770, partial [Limisphaerales bacterium]
ITLDTDPTVFGFGFSAGGGVLVSDATPRTLTVADDFQWTSGQIGTNTTISIQNQGAIGGTVILRGGHLEVNGTLNHNSGLLTALSLPPMRCLGRMRFLSAEPSTPSSSPMTLRAM